MILYHIIILKHWIRLNYINISCYYIMVIYFAVLYHFVRSLYSCLLSVCVKGGGVCVRFINYTNQINYGIFLSLCKSPRNQTLSIFSSFFLSYLFLSMQTCTFFRHKPTLTYKPRCWENEKTEVQINYEWATSTNTVIRRSQWKCNCSKQYFVNAYTKEMLRM